MGHMDAQWYLRHWGYAGPEHKTSLLCITVATYAGNE
jgi:hypothetical protein